MCFLLQSAIVLKQSTITLRPMYLNKHTKTCKTHTTITIADIITNMFLVRTKVTLLSSSRSESVDISEGNRFQFNCSAVSDPSTQPTVKWQRAIDQGLGGLEPVYNETHCVVVLGGSLTICPEGNCSATCNKYLGEYICVGSNIYTQANVTVRVNGTTGEHNIIFSQFWFL